MVMNPLLPIFPLQLVVFPGELLPLHIFEPRYRQLIHDCEAGEFVFGIPAVVNDQLGNLGTTVELVEITTVYPDGQMDIKTRGRDLFAVQRIVRQVPGKLYGGAEVTLLDNDLTGDDELLRQVLSSVKLLHKLLKVEKRLGEGKAQLTSYDLAHHAGLSLAKEYELLGLRQERERLAFLDRHLSGLLPTVMEMNALQEKIKLNGHFKKLPGFEW